MPTSLYPEKNKAKVLIDDLLRQSEKAESEKFRFQSDIYADFTASPRRRPRPNSTSLNQLDQRMILATAPGHGSLAERKAVAARSSAFFRSPLWPQVQLQLPVVHHIRDVRRERRPSPSNRTVKAFVNTWRDGLVIFDQLETAHRGA
jgi:hypothetical protein